MHTGGSRRGFTMVDLIAAVGAGAGIAAVGAATLSAASRGSLTQQDQANQMTIGQAAAQWSADHRGLIVGAPGASARDLLNDSQAAQDELANDTEGLATQPFDWASPLAWGYLSDEPAPERRDERFVRAFGVQPEFVEPGTVPVADTTAAGALGVLRDPAQGELSVPYAGAPQANGIEGTFFSIQTAGSYVAAREFLWWGQRGDEPPRWAGSDFWGDEFTGAFASSGIASPRLPGSSGTRGGSARSYRPYVHQIGTPSEKIRLADGTRYQRQDLQAIDHDVSSHAGYGGAFADIGAWSDDLENANVTNTRAWPSGTNEAGQDMTRVSFRHGDSETARGNTLRFDGSVVLIDIDDARDPALWMPRGSRVWLSDLSERYRQIYLENPRERELLKSSASPLLDRAIIW